MEGFKLSSLLTDLPLNLLNILLLYLIVKHLVYKPVKGFMEKRTQRLKDAQAAAEADAAKAGAAKAQYEQLLTDSRRQADQLLADAGQKADAQAELILADANQRAGEILSTAKDKALEERSTALASMQDEVAGLALGISEKLLGRSVDNADNEKIVRTFFAEQLKDLQDKAGAPAPDTREAVPAASVQAVRADSVRSAVTSLREEIRDLAVGVSEQLLGRSLNDEDNRRIADAFFDSHADRLLRDAQTWAANARSGKDKKAILSAGTVAVITTSDTCAQDTYLSICERLVGIFGALVFDHRVDAGVLGGFVLELNGTVYDCTVKAQLEQMRRHLISD